jgi:hypothetical protein
MQPNKGRSCLQTRFKNVVILGRVSGFAGKVFRSTVADVLSQPTVRTLFSRTIHLVQSNPWWLRMRLGDDFGDSGGDVVDHRKTCDSSRKYDYKSPQNEVMSFKCSVYIQ